MNDSVIQAAAAEIVTELKAIRMALTRIGEILEGE